VTKYIFTILTCHYL